MLCLNTRVYDTNSSKVWIEDSVVGRERRTCDLHTSASQSCEAIARTCHGEKGAKSLLERTAAMFVP